MWRQLAAAVVIAGVTQLPQRAEVAVVVRTHIQGASNNPICNFALGIATHAGENLTYYVALKDQRLLTQVMQSADGPTPSDYPGPATIVEVATSHTTRLDFARREYREQTLDQVRTGVRQSRVGAGSLESASDLFEAPPGPELPPQSARRGQKFAFEASSHDTGAMRVIAGQTARAIEVSVIAHDPGKSLEADGGWVATGTAWLAPHQPSVDTLQHAQRAYAKAIAQGIFDGVFTDIELPLAGTFHACMPEQTYVGARVVEEMERLDGTVVAASSEYQIEWSSKDYQRAASIHDLLMRRAGPNGAQSVGAAPIKRTRVLDMNWEYVEISDHVDELALTIPAGFKKK